MGLRLCGYIFSEFALHQNFIILYLFCSNMELDPEFYEGQKREIMAMLPYKHGNMSNL